MKPGSVIWSKAWTFWGKEEPFGGNGARPTSKSENWALVRGAAKEGGFEASGGEELRHFEHGDHVFVSHGWEEDDV